MSGYLIISRRIAERILIGDDVEIFVSDINGSKVDIAIKAPKEVRIHRKPSPMQAAKKNADVSGT